MVTMQDMLEDVERSMLRQRETAKKAILIAFALGVAVGLGVGLGVGAVIW